MNKNILKYFVLVFFIVYCTNDTLFYHNEYRTNDETYILFVIFILCLIFIYATKHKITTLSYKKLKRNFGDETLLEYKIIADIDNCKMEKMFVRGRLDFFWQELDYTFTISQNCKLEKAKLFAEKITNAKKLSAFMEKKMEKEINISKSEAIEYDIKNTSILLFLVTLFSYAVFLLLKYDLLC